MKFLSWVKGIFFLQIFFFSEFLVRIRGLRALIFHVIKLYIFNKYSVITTMQKPVQTAPTPQRTESVDTTLMSVVVALYAFYSFFSLFGIERCTC